MPRDNTTTYRSIITGVQEGANCVSSWFTKRSWVISSGMLWPTAITLLAFVLIQNVGQLRSLGSALTAAMYRRDSHFDGGFAASPYDLMIWWACCWLVVLVCTTFRNPRQEAQTDASSSLQWSRLDQYSLHLISVLLVLSPMFAAGLDVWQPEVLISIGTTTLLTTWIASFGWSWLFSYIICMVVAISAQHHLQWAFGSCVLGAWGFSLIFHPQWHRRRWSWLVASVVGVICSGVATLGLIFADSLLVRQLPNSITWDGRVLLLATWWILPSLIAESAKRVHSWASDYRIDLWAMVFVCSVLACAAHWPAAIFGLNTLILLQAALLSVGNIIRVNGIGRFGRTALYVSLCYGAWSVSQLDSKPDFSKYDAPMATGPWGSSSFHEYYEKWLAARGETPRDHGPLIFVAVAGGGIRAAAHASIALALADDSTGGKFGERTLMISSVSGGALGAATWLGQRVDGLPPADPARIQSGGVSPSALSLSRFYRNDFLTPVVNRMLFHDLPWSATPLPFTRPDRDILLQEQFQKAWGNLLDENNLRPKQGSFFHREVGTLSADGILPLIVFNTTSSADGRSAAYSSYPGAVRWSWQLDSKTSVARAVLDSARFAGISPVGVACARDGTFEVPRMLPPPVNCMEGFRPLAVADGGYRDNSGLAEIAVAIDELSRYGDPLDQVFVIQIRSNPDEGIRRVEGSRFDSGKLLQELLAPAIVQEAARGGHSEAYEHQIMGHSRRPHMLVWGLPHDIEAESQSIQPGEKRWPFEWLNRHAEQAKKERLLRLAPLGWTIDPESYSGLYRDSLRIQELPTSGTCEKVPPQYALLCKALANSNSVVVRPPK